MTIAIAIKAFEGIVLAADSRASIMEPTATGKLAVIHAYDHANKTVNLHKDFPIGMVTAGQGSIGRRSISTIAKDFRQRITEDPEWRLDPKTYTMQEVVTRFHEYVYEGAYVPEFATWPVKPVLCFLIAGYSANQQFPEVWELSYTEGGENKPKLVSSTDHVGIFWQGDTETLYRLILGYSGQLPETLKAAGLTDDQIQAVMEQAVQLEAPLLNPTMPIQDAVELADFLVNATTRYTQYIPGRATVGGPTEIAAMTRHEGYKWVKRKHYFDRDLNP